MDTDDKPQVAQLRLTDAPSVLAAGAILLVRIYQLLLSPLKQVFFGSTCSCRFQPTCSCYAGHALRQYGFGVVLVMLCAASYGATLGIQVDMIRFRA